MDCLSSQLVFCCLQLPTNAMLSTNSNAWPNDWTRQSRTEGVDMSKHQRPVMLVVEGGDIDSKTPMQGGRACRSQGLGGHWWVGGVAMGAPG